MASFVDMTDSLEATVFQQSFDVLKTALQIDLTDIVARFFAKDLISDDTMKWVTSIGAPPGARAIFLVSILLDKVRLEPSSFYRILAEIDACPTIQSLGERLRKELEDLKKKVAKQQQSPPSAFVSFAKLGMMSSL